MPTSGHKNSDVYSYSVPALKWLYFYAVDSAEYEGREPEYVWRASAHSIEGSP
jgi:hypothetical protein